MTAPPLDRMGALVPSPPSAPRPTTRTRADHGSSTRSPPAEKEVSVVPELLISWWFCPGPSDDK